MDDIKVIIADDEKWVRATIVNSIPFDKLGLTLTCEAANGLEALELCKLHQPDILVTDIMMPGLTGLELIQELKKSLPDLKVVIISGFNEFEYAKTAIKYGVQDFLVKPVEEEEIESILSRIKESILKERERSEKEVFFKKGYNQAVPILRDSFLNRIIHSNTLTADAICKRLKEFGISLHKSQLFIAILSPKDTSVLNSESKRNYFRNLSGRIIKRYTGGIPFLGHGQEPQLIAICLTYNEKAFLLCQRIFSRRFGGTLSIGISSSSAQIKALPDLFLQAAEALAYGFWIDKPIHQYSEGIFDSSFDLRLPTHIIDEAVLLVKACNSSSLVACTERLADYLKSKENVHPDVIKEHIRDIIQSITARLVVQDSSSNCSSIPSFSKIREAKSISELSEYSKNAVYEVFSHYNSANSSDVSNIEIAKKLMEEYYNSDISLEFIAKSVHFNPTYFSEIFKKQTGMSFIDYKTHLRIENAKKLLESTNLSISEISSKIGYNDPKYFSRLFKKVTGATIQEFKKTK